jgi:hypothetical protein
MSGNFSVYGNFVSWQKVLGFMKAGVSMPSDDTLLAIPFLSLHRMTTSADGMSVLTRISENSSCLSAKNSISLSRVGIRKLIFWSLQTAMIVSIYPVSSILGTVSRLSAM